MEGLKQIYTESNVRVRSVQARISELHNQLEKLGGKGEPTSGNGQDNESLYPSIRRLPLLGVAYADLFRRLKVQESVFEVLTQEYELAKVQEAKEIPSVKVLDPPEIPEKKSFPPRFAIIFLGTILSIALGSAWVLGRTYWEKTDRLDPRRIFVKEVLDSMKSSLHLPSANGNESAGPSGKSWIRLRRRGEDSERKKSGYRPRKLLYGLQLTFASPCRRRGEAVSGIVGLD